MWKNLGLLPCVPASLEPAEPAGLSALGLASSSKHGCTPVWTNEKNDQTCRHHQASPRTTLLQWYKFWDPNWDPFMHQLDFGSSTVQEFTDVRETCIENLNLREERLVLQSLSSLVTSAKESKTLELLV